jgi:hypothetical protein
MVIIPCDPELTNYSLEVELDEETFNLRLFWNDKDNTWYLSISDSEEEPILEGQRLVVGMPVLRHIVDRRRPFGELIAIDTSGQDIDPGIGDLGARVQLYYYELADLQE